MGKECIFRLMVHNNKVYLPLKKKLHTTQKQSNRLITDFLTNPQPNIFN